MKDATIQKICATLAEKVPDKTTGHFYRPDPRGFPEGSGRILHAPAEGAKWSLGAARRKLLPEIAMGDVYISGSDGRGRTLSSVPVPQFVRAAALEDGSGRGIHVFAVADCAGLSLADVKQIRLSLQALITERNVVSVNVCATGALGGADTLGLWGNLPAAAVRNLPKLLSRKTAGDAGNGTNKDVMDYLRFSVAAAIREAVDTMRPGSLSRAADAPVLQFTPDGGGEAVFADLRGGVLRFCSAAPAGASGFVPVQPLLNEVRAQVLIPADNKALLLAAKLRLFHASMISVSAGAEEDGDVYYATETGIVQVGADLFAALLPVWAGDFGMGQAASLLPGLIPVGLADDALGFRHLRDQLNGPAARLPMDAGKYTQTELNGALLRAAQKLI